MPCGLNSVTSIVSPKPKPEPESEPKPEPEPPGVGFLGRPGPPGPVRLLPALVQRKL